MLKKKVKSSKKLNKSQRPAAKNAGLELILALLLLKEQVKSAKPVKARKRVQKKKKPDIEARIKKENGTEFELVVSYGDPLQQVKMLDHTQLFSYLGNNIKVVEYKDNFYGDRTSAMEANDKTIGIQKAYTIIRNKKAEDNVSGGASWTYKLDRDYKAFQYWNLFNRALNLIIYELAMSIGVDSINSSPVEYAAFSQ